MRWFRRATPTTPALAAPAAAPEEAPMSVTVALSVTPTEPKHGDTVTATYTVAGNDPVPPQTATLQGDAVVGDQTLHVSTAITLPGTPALPEGFAVPTCPGLTFEATDDPAVFTALVP